MEFPLHFTAPTPADALRVQRLCPHGLASDLAFANIYLLREKYHTTLAFHHGFLFRHFAGQSRLMGYAFPYGEGDLLGALELVRQDAAARGRELRFCLLTAEQREFLEKNFPGAYSFSCDRGDADYLYERTMLAELPGASFHAKRNHIAQFTRDHPSWSSCPLSPENAADALAVAREWLTASSEPDSPALQHEIRAIQNAIELQQELSLFGTLLYVQGEPIAMSIASRISCDAIDIHYEKCHPAWRKAYPLISRETARMLPDCRYINREEDLNALGLRQSKLSYHPAIILNKYNARPHADSPLHA